MEVLIGVLRAALRTGSSRPPLPGFRARQAVTSIDLIRWVEVLGCNPEAGWGRCSHRLEPRCTCLSALLRSTCAGNGVCSTQVVARWTQRTQCSGLNKTNSKLHPLGSLPNCSQAASRWGLRAHDEETASCRILLSALRHWPRSHLWGYVTTAAHGKASRALSL
jgi:hypothetical protein